MGRVIRPNAHLMQDFSPAPPHLPVDRPIVQYIRQSTGEQIKKNIQSKIQQDEQLRKRLIKYGWKDDLIRKIDKDQGISGQKRRDQREGLKELYDMIERGEIGAIAAYDASRLWRDPTHVWYNDFITYWLIPYNIPVVMFNQVYFPTRQADMDALREEFKQAAYQLRTIYEKVNPARLQAIELGESYGGHAIPMGYIVVGPKGDRHYQIYRPHAELVECLFRRFKELGGNLSKLGRELRAMHFAFPPFEGVEEIPHAGLPYVEGVGYPLRTRSGLVSLLTNPAYIGWYCFSRKTGETRKSKSRERDSNGKHTYRDVPVYETVVISKEAHEPAVDYDLFMYAYSRLSPTTLEGEVNENRPKVERRFVDVPAFLDGVLESDGIPVYPIAHRRHYVARAYVDGETTSELAVSIDKLDQMVTQAILMVITALEQRHREGLQDSMHEQLTALQQIKATETNSYQKDLASVEKGIRQAELEKKVALEEEYEPGVKAAIKQLKQLHEAKTILEEKLRRATVEQSEIAETKNLLAEVVTKWNEMPFERQRRFIKLMVLRANLTEATPHFLKIELALRDPLSCTLIGHFYRHLGSKPAWTDPESDTIAALYLQADRKDILAALPTRTWEAITQQASQHDIKRLTRLNTSDIPDTMTHADMALCDELDRPWPWQQSAVYWEIPQPVNAMLIRAFDDQKLRVSDLIRLKTGRAGTPSSGEDKNLISTTLSMQLNQAGPHVSKDVLWG